MIKKAFIFLLFAGICLGQKDALSQTKTADSIGQKPDMTQLKYEDIKWAKSEGTSFWFYYKPTQYFFKNDEFETIMLENNDILVYLHELQRYVLLSDYGKAEKGKEHTVEPVANSTCVFIRSDLKGYWIFDKGFHVPNLQVVGINANRQYTLKSGLTDKRYVIDEADFKFGKLSAPIGILGE